jgi:hypothetical protein
MPSTIELLPDDIKQKVDKQLVANRFSRLDEVTEFVNNLLTSQGLEMKISRSALGRYSHDNLQPLINRLQFSTKMAEAIANASADEQGNVDSALIRLTQEALFNKLTELESQENVEPKDLASISQAISKIVDSSTRVKRYREEVKEKALQVAGDVQSALKKGGLSDEIAEAIRGKILGIAS